MPTEIPINKGYMVHMHKPLVRTNFRRVKANVFYLLLYSIVLRTLSLSCHVMFTSNGFIFAHKPISHQTLYISHKDKLLETPTAKKTDLELCLICNIQGKSGQVEIKLLKLSSTLSVEKAARFFLDACSRI